MSTIFVLKPIIDVLYQEVSEYKKEIERLNKIISELTAERKTSVKTVSISDNTVSNVLKNTKKVANEVVEINEEALATLAEAPPSSSPDPLLNQEENIDEEEQIPTIVQEEKKIVKLIAGKDKKEYMKEYHRNYRKKQKEMNK